MTIILLNAEFPRSNLAINKINDGVTATAGLNKVPLSKVSITPPGIGRLPMNPEMAAKKKPKKKDQTAGPRPSSGRDSNCQRHTGHSRPADDTERVDATCPNKYRNFIYQQK